MRRITSALLIVLAVIFAGAVPAMAQGRGRASPHETISAVIDGCRVTITYGRPYSKDPRGSEIRKIWGTLVPWGKAWRLGADESTVLITEQPLAIGDATIPAGAYRLYFAPTEQGSKLVFNTKLGGWGIKSDGTVDETGDLVRVDATKSSLDKSVDQLTLAIEKNAPSGGVIRINWETTQYSVPFTIKK